MVVTMPFVPALALMLAGSATTQDSSNDILFALAMEAVGRSPHPVVLPAILTKASTYALGEQPYLSWGNEERRLAFDTLMTKKYIPGLKEWWSGPDPYRSSKLVFIVQFTLDLHSPHYTYSRGFSMKSQSAYDDGTADILARWVTGLSAKQRDELLKGGIPAKDLSDSQLTAITSMLPTGATISVNGVPLEEEKTLSLRVWINAAVRSGKSWFETNLASS